MTRYAIREPNKGEIVAYHVRHGQPDGSKRFTWELPDGTIGLNGLKTADLPLFGAAAAHRWDVDEPVIVCEGEKAAAACVKAKYQAVGTVTGAGSCPGPGPLAVLIGMRVILWADSDHAGTMHMLRIARAIEHATNGLAWVVWSDAPDGGDAADALTVGGKALIDALVADAGKVPLPEPTPGELIDFAKAEERRKARRPAPPTESPIDAFNRSVTVSAVLARAYGIEARPGHAVRCPRHDDRSPSLSILPDDRRVFCHSPSCELNNNGQGRDAWDLHNLVEGVAS